MSGYLQQLYVKVKHRGVRRRLGLLQRLCQRRHRPGERCAVAMGVYKMVVACEGGAAEARRRGSRKARALAWESHVWLLY